MRTETATRRGIALAPFKSSSVKACCRQLSSCPSVAALESEAVKIGVREIVGTPVRKYRIHHDDKRPGVLIEGTYYLPSLIEVLWHDGRGMRLFGSGWSAAASSGHPCRAFASCA